VIFFKLSAGMKMDVIKYFQDQKLLGKLCG